jgi:hypothetical protein
MSDSRVLHLQGRRNIPLLAWWLNSSMLCQTDWGNKGIRWEEVLRELAWRQRAVSLWWGSRVDLASATFRALG